MATPALAAAPNILTAAKTTNPPLIVGHGSHRYRVEKDWSKADHPKVPLENCHEMIQASDGRLFLVTDHPKNNILIYNTVGNLLDHWTLNSKTAHGLALQREGIQIDRKVFQRSGCGCIRVTLFLTICRRLGHGDLTDPV